MMKINVRALRNLFGSEPLAEVTLEQDNVKVESGILDKNEIQTYAETFIEAFDELMGLLPDDMQYEILTQTSFKSWYECLKDSEED